MALTDEQRIDVARFLGNIQSDWPEDELSPAQLQAFAAEQTMPEQEPALPLSEPPKPELSPGTELSTPSGYLAALDKARQLDAIQAAAAAASQGIAQVGQIASRGLFKPQAAPPILSAAADIEQRRAAVMDFVRQERERQRAAADLGLTPFRRDLLLQQTAAAKALAEQRAREPEPRPSLIAKQEAETEKIRKETELLGKPKPVSPPKPSAAPTKEERITTGLRKEFEAQQAVKSFSEIQSSFGKIAEAAKGATPASDLSMLYSYAKLLDPGSVVRESEFSTMAQTGAFGDKVAAAVKKITSGQRLTDAQRQDFVRAGKEQFNVYKKQFDETAKRYEGLAAKSGVSPQDVVFRRQAFTDESGPSTPTALPQAAPSTVRVRRKSDGRVVDVPAADVEKFVAAGKVERLP